MAKTTAAKVIDQCASQVGYREGRNNYNKYAPIAGHANYLAWCATFLVAEFKVAGQELPSGATTAGCYNNVEAFKRAKRFSYYPGVGAIFFLGSAGQTHTGLVYSYDSIYIYTIEGNTNDDGSANGNGVYKRRRTRASVYGYGYPDYSHPIVEADPKWGPPQSSQEPASDILPSVELYNVQPGDTNSDVLLLQKALKKVYPSFDYSSGPGIFGPLTEAAYAKYQKSLGYEGADADGAPGETSLKALADKTKLFVVGGNKPSISVADVQPGKVNNSVELVQKALKKVYPDFDYSSGPGIFGPLTTQFYAKWQRSLDYSGADANGGPGESSLKRLATQTGIFTVN